MLSIYKRGQDPPGTGANMADPRISKPESECVNPFSRQLSGQQSVGFLRRVDQDPTSSIILFYMSHIKVSIITLACWEVIVKISRVLIGSTSLLSHFFIEYFVCDASLRL